MVGSDTQEFRLWSERVQLEIRILRYAGSARDGLHHEDGVKWQHGLMTTCATGRQIMVLETMNAIMSRPGTVERHLDDPWKRDHFASPGLANVDKLSVNRPQDFMSVEDLAKVGLKTQLNEVMRWKPRNVSRKATVHCEVLWEYLLTLRESSL